MVPPDRSIEQPGIEQPEYPFSDAQAKEQVIELARQITRLNTLPNLSAGLYFQSCNDQGEPPFQVILEMSFTTPPPDPGSPGAADGYLRGIAATMSSHGWLDGPVDGWRPPGTVLHSDGVMATLMTGPKPGWTKIRLDGQCRDMTDHRTDPTGWTDITGDLTAR